jgi:hypothetical protein
MSLPEKGPRISARMLHTIVLALTAILVLVIGLLVKPPQRITNGDTRATLLLSQEIIQHGTIRLDRLGKQELARYDYVIQEKNGHFYCFFPIGAALLSTPFVAVANILGYDMLDSEDAAQRWLTSLLVVVMFLLLYALARLFVDGSEALGLATLCLFGTSFASTGMTSLWSHDFAVIIALAAMLVAFRSIEKDRPLPRAGLALLLLFAYLCRPTMALFAPALIAWLACHRLRDALKVTAWLGLFLLGFIAWSHHEFGQWLPDYYQPGRLQGGEFATATVQNLIGPSRGLFVFSPFLLVPIVLATWLWRTNRSYACALILGIGWPLAHWLTISTFPHWWAGWSFGPRLMIDCLPGLCLLLILSYRELGQSRRMVAAVLVVLGAFSIQVNTAYALFDEYAFLWNSDPVVDQYPEYVSDWRYPQVLHNAERHRLRIEEFERTRVMPSDSPDELFQGWSGAEAGATGAVRWIEGERARITLPIEDAASLEGTLLLDLIVRNEPSVRILLNGHVLRQGVLQASERKARFDFDPSFFVSGFNAIDFELFGADPSVATGGSQPSLGIRSVSIVTRSQP